MRISDWSSDVCSSDLRPSRPVPDLNQRCRKAKKLLPRRRKPCARLVSDKYRAVELILKNPDAGTDCRLREIEVDRRIDKAALFDNLQKDRKTVVKGQSV